ncbi:MAG TPA: PBP1A family penicillin-binding protein [Polyangia bacterium]|nr:PBP1A family penicillin-binding protein [Polyangia bacterium]
MLLTLMGSAFGAGLAYWGYKQFEKDLPDRWSALTDYRPSRASRVFSSEGELIGEFYLQKRIVLPYDRIPAHVRNAFVAAEDNRFFDHHGIDPLGILRASFANMKAGRVVQGGSTITQQVAKLMLVGNERNLVRKIREAILAHKIENKLSKDQILGIYLNHVYLGHGAYGVQAAAEVYFGKDAKDLTIAEAAMLGGLPKAPTEDSPFSAFKRARDRQHYVLGQMFENNFISATQLREAEQESIAIISKDTPLNHIAAPYFVEHVRKLVQAKYGGRDLFDRGLRIQTTLVMSQQRAAEAAIKLGLENVDRRFGFRGAVGHLDGDDRQTFLEGLPQPYAGAHVEARAAAGALVVGKPYLAMYERSGKRSYARMGAIRMNLDDADAQKIERWKEHRGNQLRDGDLIPVRVVKLDVKKGKSVETQELAQLAQRPEIQGALVALDPATGKLTAMVGGYDYDLSQFNRATQARRQAGSSIKPYIYSAALEHGFTEVSIVPDAPVSIKTAAGVWSPHNYKAEYLGPITLRTALQKSINTVSVRLVAAIGVDKVIEQIRKFGITAQIVRHPSIALGTPEVTLLEHAYGYATFPAGGMEVKPVLIEKILDADGNVVEEFKPEPARRRIAADTAYVMVDMMKNVIEKGTGTKAKELGRPAGGKTGTSNDFEDNWFMAFTRDLVCGVWVGRDDFKSIGFDATGGTTAAPIWTDFMKAAHPATPIRDFEAPPGVYFVRATPDRGMPAKPGTPGALLLPFKRGTLPPQFARSEGKAGLTDDVF